jgi:hypothetical protein
MLLEQVVSRVLISTFNMVKQAKTDFQTPSARVQDHRRKRAGTDLRRDLGISEGIWNLKERFPGHDRARLC